MAANLLACQQGLEQLAGEVFNIAFGKRVTINDLVASINQLLNSNMLPEYAEPRPGDVKHSFANIGKARQFLGYDPIVNFLKGLERIVFSI